MSFASALARHLAVSEDGGVAPPGAGPTQVWYQPDGSRIALFSHGDSFDLYIGKKTIYNLTLTPQVAVSIAFWLLWWWVKQWFGLKLALWHWCVGKLVGRG